MGCTSGGGRTSGQGRARGRGLGGSGNEVQVKIEKVPQSRVVMLLCYVPQICDYNFDHRL